MLLFYPTHSKCIPLSKSTKRFFFIQPGNDLISFFLNEHTDTALSHSCTTWCFFPPFGKLSKYL